MRYTEIMTKKQTKKTDKKPQNEEEFQPNKLALTVAALAAVTIALFAVIGSSF